MNPVIATITPDTDTVLQIAQQANARHLHIITDGRRTVLSPEVPPGWYKIVVKHKPQRAAA